MKYFIKEFLPRDFSLYNEEIRGLIFGPQIITYSGYGYDRSEPEQINIAVKILDVFL